MAGLLNATISHNFWSCQGALNRPTVRINSLRNDCSSQSELNSPIAKRHCSVVQRKHSRCAFIATLLMHSFPAHIARFVIFAVVNSAKRMLVRWCKTNISKKLFKVQPAVTDFDTKSAVPVIALHGWVLASANHRIPSAPFFGSFPIRGVSVLSHALSQSVMRSHYTPRLGFV